MSFGFNKNKQKSSQQSSNEVNPWAYSVPHLQNIQDIAGQEYAENLNNQFLGGINPNDVYADPTANQQAIMNIGAENYIGLDPSNFTDSTSYMNQVLQGTDSTLAGVNQRNFMSGQGTDYMNNQVAGLGRNAFDELGKSSDQWVKDLSKSVTDQIYNSTASKFAMDGRFDPNSGQFQRTVSTGISDSIADDLLKYYSADRGLEFDAKDRHIQNQYNAGATQQENMYNAMNQAQSNQINMASEIPTIQDIIYGNYDQGLGSSFGWDQYGVDQQNALNQLLIAQSLYNQDKDMTALEDYYNMTMAIGSGFPMQISQGTQSGKSSGFGGGFSFG